MIGYNPKQLGKYYIIFTQISSSKIQLHLLNVLMSFKKQIRNGINMH